jgi:hypothetical protein
MPKAETEDDTWDSYRDDYPFTESRLPPAIHIIRHGITGTPLCVFKNPDDVEAWLDDFEEEAEAFDVVEFPGSYPMLVLEKDGNLFPVTESGLQRALYVLRDDKEFACKLFYLSNDLDEKAMKGGLETYEIHHNWIRWWKVNDLPWINNWECDAAIDPDDPTPEPEYDEDGELIDVALDESGLWREPLPMPDAELKELAMAMRAGTVFSSDHLRANQGNMLGSVFMPLMLGGRNMHRNIAIHDITLFYEELSQASPRAINGLPCFTSVRLLCRTEHQRLRDKIQAIEKALAAV